MQALAAGSILLLVASSIAVGLRLLTRWSRTRGLPELLLGAMLLLTVGIGYPGLIAASRMQGDWLAPLFVLANLAVSGGFSLLYLFTWRVFRPDAAWAKGLAGAGVALLAANALLRIHDVLVAHQVRMANEAVAESLLQTGVVTLAYLWTSWESLRYYGLMKRRVRIGLADPAVANRFLLWGTMSLVTSAGIVINSMAIAFGIDAMNDPAVLLGSSLTGYAQTVLLLLALLPPKAYLDRIRARAAVDAVPQEA